jgi:UDP-arabinose 4-epimerase
LVSTAGTHHPTRDGTAIRDFIHVVDLVDAHVLGVKHLANPPEVFNIGTGRGISVREFVDACRAVTGERITIREQADARPGDYAEVCYCFLWLFVSVKQLVFQVTMSRYIEDEGDAAC